MVRLLEMPVDKLLVLESSATKRLEKWLKMKLEIRLTLLNVSRKVVDINNIKETTEIDTTLRAVAMTTVDVSINTACNSALILQIKMFN